MRAARGAGEANDKEIRKVAAQKHEFKEARPARIKVGFVASKIDRNKLCRSIDLAESLIHTSSANSFRRAGISVRQCRGEWRLDSASAYSSVELRRQFERSARRPAAVIGRLLLMTFINFHTFRIQCEKGAISQVRVKSKASPADFWRNPTDLIMVKPTEHEIAWGRFGLGNALVPLVPKVFRRGLR
jgi:hypothetical protein